MQIETTKLTIEDIIAAAKSAGISCENCKQFDTENSCLAPNDFSEINLTEISENPKTHFCAEFKPK